MVDAYHLARLLLTRVGNHQLAWLVADRPIGILTQPDEPALVALSSWHMACALMSLGFYVESRDYALAAALEVSVPPTGQLDISIYGALQLVAAQGAAGAADLSGAEDLMAEADRIAGKLDRDAPCLKVWFGVSEVTITAMEIALQRGRIDEAIGLASSVHLPENSAADRQVRFYLTTAYAYSQKKGEDFAALYALQQAERVCSEDIRYHWMAHRTLQRLSHSKHRLIKTDLAKLLAVAGLK